MDETLSKRLSSYASRTAAVSLPSLRLPGATRGAGLLDPSVLGLNKLFGVSLKATNRLGAVQSDSSASVDLHGATAVEGSRLEATVNSFGRGHAILFDRNVGLTNGDGENLDVAGSLRLLLDRYVRIEQPMVVDAPGYVDSHIPPRRKGRHASCPRQSFRQEARMPLNPSPTSG